MKCPYCGYDNIAGTDACENCLQDLASRDGISVPRARIQKVLMSDPIAKVPPHEAVCVKETTSIPDAVERMNQSKTGCVLVEGSEGELKGILTERDILLRVMGKSGDLSKATVAQAMTANVETLDEDDTLAYALHQMSVHRCRHIPIIRKNKKPGVVSVLDLLCHLAKLFPEKPG
ncbi:MAG: CBS domain-containing protein [Deltaproteobacteria bacterium]|nr:CBS domain-containing protein [Deltaproteobacteria bacterium]